MEEELQESHRLVAQLGADNERLQFEQGKFAPVSLYVGPSNEIPSLVIKPPS